VAGECMAMTCADLGTERVPGQFTSTTTEARESAWRWPNAKQRDALFASPSLNDDMQLEPGGGRRLGLLRGS
jgi:hypothetical protein